jgi:hypothetical protein
MEKKMINAFEEALKNINKDAKPERIPEEENFRIHEEINAEMKALKRELQKKEIDSFNRNANILFT